MPAGYKERPEGAISGGFPKHRDSSRLLEFVKSGPQIKCNQNSKARKAPPPQHTHTQQGDTAIREALGLRELLLQASVSSSVKWEYQKHFEAQRVGWRCSVYAA